jgi:hypothetical protein
MTSRSVAQLITVTLACMVPLLAGGTLWAILENGTQNADLATQVRNLKREGAERRDQTCLLFEGQHLTEVKQLERTYEYLSGLSQAQLSEPLNRAVMLGLSAQEEEAKDRAPAYCDVKGVGLPEPDPVIPKRPEGLR